MTMCVSFLSRGSSMGYSDAWLFSGENEIVSVGRRCVSLYGN